MTDDIKELENPIKVIDNLEKLSDIFQNLDNILFDEKNYYNIQKMMIKSSFNFHIKNNESYRNYVETFNFDHTIEDFDINDIPLIPSSFFKKENIDVKSLPNEEIIKNCTSSGTLGNLSIVPRDEDTLLNFYSSISSVMSFIFDIERSGNHKVFILGPDTEEAGDLWFSYVLSSMALSFQTEYFERNGEFCFEEAYKKLNNAIQAGNEILIIGPPFRILELCEYIVKVNGNLALPGNSFVVSAGGWKNRQREAIPRQEYKSKVKSTFGIDLCAVRDSFNMVELNTVVNECEYHQKHVLPWMNVVARDPKTNEVLQDGEVGILAFYDSTSFSYPCFILSEDYGITYSDKCDCGRIGKRFEIVRRMNRIESRGCALKMATDKKVDRNSTRYYKSFFRDPSHYKDMID